MNEEQDEHIDETEEAESEEPVKSIEERLYALTRRLGWAVFILVILVVVLEVQIQRRNGDIDDLQVVVAEAKDAAESARISAERTEGYVDEVVEDATTSEQIDPARVNFVLTAMLEMRDALCTQGIIECPGG